MKARFPFVCLLLSLLAACASLRRSDTAHVRKIVESHFPISSDTYALLEEQWFPATNMHARLGEPYVELHASSQTKTLTMGLLGIAEYEGLNATIYCDDITASFRRVLASNYTGQTTTLVRSEDIQDFRLRETAKNEVRGEFTFAVRAVMTAKCRFIVQGDALTYLGIERMNPVHEFDCVHLLSPEGDLWESSFWNWAGPTYFLIMKPARPPLQALSVADQHRQLRQLRDRTVWGEHVVRPSYNMPVLFNENAYVFTIFIGGNLYETLMAVAQDNQWGILRICRAVFFPEHGKYPPTMAEYYDYMSGYRDYVLEFGKKLNREMDERPVPAGEGVSLRLSVTTNANDTIETVLHVVSEPANVLSH